MAGTDLSLCLRKDNGESLAAAQRFGLSVEVSCYLDHAAVGPAAVERATSVHLPWNVPSLGRLNYAATDAEYRRAAVELIGDRIDSAARHFPHARIVVAHSAPRRWDHHEHADARRGDYGLLVDSLRRLAERAGAVGLVLALENNNAYPLNERNEWDWQAGRLREAARYFADAPAEWLSVYDDVAHESFRLCLDTAHACTWAHSIDDHGTRVEALLSFLTRPEAVAHAHWNDHEAFAPEGRVDRHLCIGTGTIPVPVHRRVKGLGICPLLEHFESEEALAAELDYIARL